MANLNGVLYLAIEGANRLAQYRRQAAGRAPAHETVSVEPVQRVRGGLSWLSAGVLLSAGVGTYMFLQYGVSNKRKAALDAYETSVGEAQVGGPFKLTDTAGKEFTSSQLHGEFSVLYFGFTHCPDICPDELEKMAQAIDMVGAPTNASPSTFSLGPARAATASGLQSLTP
jgi:protein SCO1